MVETPTSVRRPAPLACDACRRKHVKCDGTTPVCGRCSTNALACTYTASRRGLARRRRRTAATDEGASTSSALQSPAHSHASASRSYVGDVGPARSHADASAGVRAETAHLLGSLVLNNTLQSVDNQEMPPRPSASPAPYLWSPSPADHERLLALFYLHLFGAHPFLVPKAFYASQRYPYYLDLVVCFAGQQYAAPNSDTALLQSAASSAMSGVDEQTPYRVQALLLYAIILHASQQTKEAGECVSRAATIALQLGMNEESFARANSANSSVTEESLRRTWWELYTVDVYFAAIHRRPTFETTSAKSFPFLPCAQGLYEAGQCEPNPPSLHTFERRVFSVDSNVSFSSSCVRIDAIRIVGRVLALAPTTDAHPESIQALDNALTSWEYNLPPLCTDVVDSSGEVDLMLFEARCFILCADIFLHFPRSDLPDTVPSARDIACAKGYTQLAPTSKHHTIKAIAASKSLANLATVPWPLDRHSPFFICGLVLGCIIQLAAASIHMHQRGPDFLQQDRDRVVLMVGALQRLGERWALARNAVRCLKSVAEIVFTTYDEDGSLSTEAQSFRDSAIDEGDNVSNPMWFDLFSVDELQGNFFDI
ncbi:hypothetical protein Q7P35_008547 [Cladosporium inversicolor]